ncbi:MAG TPA: hypothetical protein VFZ65_07875 [Planctomycetota bacterium]|nr:hypothetical protein [Planctomycetota bacterium]
MRTPIIVLFSLFVAALPAQGATVSFYGAGCTYQQPLAIGVQGLPQLGTTVGITYSGPNLNTSLQVQPVLALGLGANNIPIPSGILPQQPVGCSVWIDPIVLYPMPVTTTGLFATRYDFVVPNDPTLTGFVFVGQWLAIAVQCGFVPPCWLDALPTSDAALLTVGI